METFLRKKEVWKHSYKKKKYGNILTKKISISFQKKFEKVL